MVRREGKKVGGALRGAQATALEGEQASEHDGKKCQR